MNKQATQVLLVEDNAADAGLIRRIFARAGRENWQLVQAESLSEAIDTCQEYMRLVQRDRAFDIVLLDPGLPDSKGLETIRQFRATISNVPIVVLTGIDDERLALQAIAEGAQDFLVKDEITIHQLVKTTLYAMERFNISRQSQVPEQGNPFIQD
jgi:CheY-like chemotaxis protein